MGENLEDYCRACGHLHQLHAATGCLARTPGTADAPPASCRCGLPPSRGRKARGPGVVLEFTRPKRA